MFGFFARKGTTGFLKWLGVDEATARAIGFTIGSVVAIATFDPISVTIDLAALAADAGSAAADAATTVTDTTAMVAQVGAECVQDAADSTHALVNGASLYHRDDSQESLVIPI